MFVSLKKFDDIFRLCINHQLLLLLGRKSYLKKRRYSPDDIADHNVEDYVLGLFFKNPYKKIWSIQDLYDHSNNYAVGRLFGISELAEEVVFCHDIPPEAEINISPGSVKKVMDLMSYSQRTVAWEIIRPLGPATLEEIAIHMDVIKTPDWDFTDMVSVLVRVISILPEKRFLKAISEIIIKEMGEGNG